MMINARELGIPWELMHENLGFFHGFNQET
jgi:hypothetical protein